MAEKTGQTKSKRASRSWRKHIRRVKQGARKTGTPPRSPIGPLRPPRASEQKD